MSCSTVAHRTAAMLYAAPGSKRLCDVSTPIDGPANRTELASLDGAVQLGSLIFINQVFSVID